MRRIFSVLYQNIVYNTSMFNLQKRQFCDVIQLKNDQWNAAHLLCFYIQIWESAWGNPSGGVRVGESESGSPNLGIQIQEPESLQSLLPKIKMSNKL